MALAAMLGVLLCLGGMARAEALTIEEAIDLALENNAALRAQRQSIAMAEGEHVTARTFPNNPRLEVEGATGTERNAGREEVRQAMAKLSQELELGGRRRLRTEIASAALKQAQWEVRDAQRELITEVLEAFYRILFLDQKHSFVEQAVGLAGQLADIAEERYRVGDSPQLDVNLARVELQNTIRERDEVARELAQEQLSLNRLLGRPLKANVVLEGMLAAPRGALDGERLRQLALRERPDLQGRTAAVAVAEGEGALVKAERLPEVEVALIFERERTGEEVENSVGASISLPLPLWNRKRGEIQAAQARVRFAELEVAALREAIGAEVAQTVAEADQLRATLQLFEETILSQSSENLELLRQAFSAGELGIVPVIGEQRAFMAINLDYLDAQLAHRLALVALEGIVGAPIEGQQ